MSALILLACVVPPLSVMAIAVFHGFRTGHAGILALLALSIGLLAGPALLVSAGADDPARSFRFDVAGAAAERHAALLQRSEPASAERGL